MTDKEMALSIGQRLIQLKRENAALKGILNACRTNDSPLQWRAMLAETLKGSAHTAQERTEWLETLIGNQDSHTSLVHIIHQHMLHPTEWD
jgi:hypothetical protein